MPIAEDREQVGRYEVVCRLARGGMAEILLGRLTGPSGFERSVVIKRILPSYADERQFVEMFLDEARIAARIHHPNVVQHQELGDDGEQLYLVMEYLEGESLASLQRRARSRADLLEPAESIHIVASAAAGLHAAHQLTDRDGQPLGIVHRDISPQNLFVTYRGGVKVMDFGIAKASDRITSTEAGSLKGKVRYMSPEQARGESLDQRSDLFSLAVVLYELTTGHALFRRASPLASLRAVQDDPIPPPSSLVPDYPAALERVCLKALARDRDDRHADVDEFRRELLDVQQAIGGPPRPEEALAAHMERLFADRIAEKREMLRQVSVGAAPPSPPEPEVDTEVEIPSVLLTDVAVTVAAVPQTTAVPRTNAEQQPLAEPRRSATPWIVAGLGALVVGAVGALQVFGAEAAPDTASSLPAPSAPSPALTSTVAPEVRPEEVPTTVHVSVESDPSGAAVVLAGEELGTTPTSIDLEAGEAPVELVLRRSGYRPLAVPLVPDVDQRLRLSLQREPRRRQRATPAAPEAAEPAAMTAFPRFN